MTFDEFAVVEFEQLEFGPMCRCDHPSCYSCNPGIYSNAPAAVKEALLEASECKKQPLKAEEALKRIAARFSKDDVAVIKRDEYEALKELYDFTSAAKKELEKSETPFYAGMKRLNEVV